MVLANVYNFEGIACLGKINSHNLSKIYGNGRFFPLNHLFDIRKVKERKFKNFYWHGKIRF